MKKLTMSLVGLAFVLCAFSTQAVAAVEDVIVVAAASCTTDASCTDSDLCNGAEKCIASSCAPGTPLVCNDGAYCNGLETCNAATGCVSGTAPACNDGAYCNGVESCNEATDSCNAGTPVSCNDGAYCNGIESCNEATDSCNAGTPPCQEGVACDEETNLCVECVSDDNCTGDAPYCQANQCVECRNNGDCPQDGDPCNGTEVCSSGTCGSTGDPCPGQICIPNVNPNSQPASALPPPYICQDCVSDDNCTDELYCNGAEYCSNGTCYSEGDPCIEQGSSLPADLVGPICDEANDACVECVSDDNCTDEAKPFCDENNACVECLSDGNCDDGVFCNGTETCDNGTCMPFEGDVCEGELCNEEIDQCVGCLADRDCEGDNNTPRCGESFQCVQCLDALDCAEEEVCNEEGTCVTAVCELKIKPNKIRINKMFRPIERKFKITGSDGFDPYAEMDFGILQPNVRTASVNKKGKLTVLVTVPSSARLYKGPVEIRVGNCVGYVTLK